jgi:hypothetical protein
LKGKSQKARNKGKRSKFILTLAGELLIIRTIIETYSCHTGKEYLVPIDEYLGIDKLKYNMTLPMEIEVADWGQNQSSFRAAEERMQEKLNINISREQIRKITYKVGGQVFDEDTKNAEESIKNLESMQFENKRCGTLYIMIDGAAINTRIPKLEEDGSTWCETKMVEAFSSDNLRMRKSKNGSIDGEKHYSILEKEYMPYIGHVWDFKKYVLDCAIRNGYGQYEKTVVVSDGATWIRKMCEELFPDAIQILDLYHLSEHVYEFSKSLFNNDESQYVPYAEKLIDQLKNSKSTDVLKELEKYGNHSLYTYIQNNENKIDYVTYKSEGYYVGSGPIESGNKIILQRRCKQAGMRWNVENANRLLSLRAKKESGLWTTGVERIVLAA